MNLRPLFSATRALLAVCLAVLSVMAKADDEVHLTLLQVNDVYQTMPVDKGKRGGPRAWLR